MQENKIRMLIKEILLTDEVENKEKVENKENKDKENKLNFILVQNKTYSVSKSNQTYTISNNMINIIRDLTKIYNKNISVNINNNIAILYIIKYATSSEKYVNYTIMPFQVFIKINIYYYLLNLPNIFDQFNLLEEINLTKFTFEIIEYIKYSTKQDILEQKTLYHNLYSNNKNNIILEDNVILDKIYEKRIILFNDIIKDQLSLFKPFMSYIYIINNMFNNKNFILAHNKKLTDQEVYNLVILNSPKFKLAITKYGQRAFNIKLLEEFYVLMPIYLLLKLDYYKLKHSSITLGYNDSFCLQESCILFNAKLSVREKNSILRSLFLKTQLLLLELDASLEEHKDKIKIYGYVYLITNNKTKQRFVNINYNSNNLKQIISSLYQEAITFNVRDKSNLTYKLLEALTLNFYNTFSFKIIKTKLVNDTKLDLSSIADELIEKYNCLTLGYNIAIKKKKNLYI